MGITVGDGAGGAGVAVGGGDGGCAGVDVGRPGGKPGKPVPVGAAPGDRVGGVVAPPPDDEPPDDAIGPSSILPPHPQTQIRRATTLEKRIPRLLSGDP
jgi:hypothetical protein